MATLLQPAQVGIREDLADYIAVVDAKSTPFVSMAPKGKDLGNMTFSWQADDYDAPKTSGTKDGDDVTVYDNPSQYRTKLSNFAQVFRRNLRIGFVAETQNVAGVTDEVARGISKRLVEIKRDMEASFLCPNQAAVQEGANPYLTSSLGAWLTISNSSNIGGVAAGSRFEPNTGAITSTTSANLVESTVQGVLTSIYNKTGVFRDYDCIVGPTLKRAFTNLTSGATTLVSNSNTIAATSVRTFNTDISSDTFKSSIDIFEGDFGRLVLHPDTLIGYMSGTTWTVQPQKGYVIPMDMVEVRYAKLPEVKELPDNGGGPARLVQAIAGLVVKNPAGFGMFNGAS